MTLSHWTNNKGDIYILMPYFYLFYSHLLFSTNVTRDFQLASQLVTFPRYYLLHFPECVPDSDLIQFSSLEKSDSNTNVHKKTGESSYFFLAGPVWIETEKRLKLKSQEFFIRIKKNNANFIILCRNSVQLYTDVAFIIYSYIVFFSFHLVSTHGFISKSCHYPYLD